MRAEETWRAVCVFNWTLTCCVEAQNQKEPVFELASWLFVQMASGGPEAPESPEQCAEAQPEEVAVVMSPESKVMRHALFAELGNMAMQLVCILDDMDDKFEDDPSLLVEMNLSREEVNRTLRFLRKLSDKARDAQSAILDELVENLDPGRAPEPTAVTHSNIQGERGVAGDGWM